MAGIPTITVTAQRLPPIGPTQTAPVVGLSAQSLPENSPLLAGSSLISNALGPAIASFIANTGPNRTKPALTPVSLYSLALRASAPPFIPIFVYTFPLSPANIRREVNAAGNFYDVLGSPTNFGVNRIVDVYGQSPPIINLMGTTGVKFHSRDGFIWSGLQSVQILNGMISQYFSLNAAAAQAGNKSLYRLEFYDFYMGEFWEVVPLGPQGLLQSNSQPQLVYYRFRLVGVVSLEQPIAALADSLLSTLSSGIDNAFSSLQSSVSNFLGSYTSLGNT